MNTIQPLVSHNPTLVTIYTFPVGGTYNSEGQPSQDLGDQLVRANSQYETHKTMKAQITGVSDRQIKIILQPLEFNHIPQIIEVENRGPANRRGYYHLETTDRVLSHGAREYIGTMNIGMSFAGQLPLGKVSARVHRFLNNSVMQKGMRIGGGQQKDEGFDYSTEPYGLGFDDGQDFTHFEGCTPNGSYNSTMTLSTYGKGYGFYPPENKTVGDRTKYRANLLDGYRIGRYLNNQQENFFETYKERKFTPGISVINRTTQGGDGMRYKVVVYQIAGTFETSHGQYLCAIVLDDRGKCKNVEGRWSGSEKTRDKFFDYGIGLKITDAYFTTESTQGLVANSDINGIQTKSIYNGYPSSTEGGTNGIAGGNGYGFFTPPIPYLSFFLNIMESNEYFKAAKNNVQPKPSEKPEQGGGGNGFGTGKLVGVYDFPLATMLKISELQFMPFMPVYGHASDPNNPDTDVDYKWKLYVPFFVINPHQFHELAGVNFDNRKGLQPLLYKTFGGKNIWKNRGAQDYRTRYHLNPSTNVLTQCGVSDGSLINKDYHQFIINPYPTDDAHPKLLNAYAQSRALVYGQPQCPRYEGWFAGFWKTNLPNNRAVLGWKVARNPNPHCGGGADSGISFNGTKFITFSDATPQSGLYEGRGTFAVATDKYQQYIQSVRSQINTGLVVANERMLMSAFGGLAGSVGSAVAGGVSLGAAGAIAGASGAANAITNVGSALINYRHTEMELRAKFHDARMSSRAQNILPADISDDYLNKLANSNSNEGGALYYRPQLYGSEFPIVDSTGIKSFGRSNLTVVNSNTLQTQNTPLGTEPVRFPSSKDSVDYYETLTWKIGIKGGFDVTLGELFADTINNNPNYCYGYTTPDNEKPYYGDNVSSSSTIGIFGAYLGQPQESKPFNNPFTYFQCTVNREQLKNQLGYSNYGEGSEGMIDALAELFEAGIRIGNRSPQFNNNDRFMLCFADKQELYLPEHAQQPATLQEGGTADLCSSISNDSTTNTRSTRKRKSRQ